MPERILFLDFDGVLNSTGWAVRTQQKGVWGIDRDTIPALQRILDATGCEIVVSSTWRLFHSLAELRRKLRLAGLRDPIPIIDRTPTLREGFRGAEVEAWRSLICFQGPYVILDDDSDFYPEQPLIKTNGDVGLTFADASRAIRSLLTQAPA